MNNYRKIAIFFPSFNIGGVERVMIDLANTLHSLGERVSIVVCNNSGKLKESLNVEIPIFSLDVKLRRALFPLKRFVKEQNITVLLSGPDFPNFLSVLASRLLKYPPQIYLTQHNLFNAESKKLGLHGQLSPLLYRILYPYAKSVIAVSDACKHMLQNLGISPLKVTKINNPIDIDAISKNSEQLLDYQIPEDYILFIGRLTYIKNIELLIRAFNNISREIKNLHLVIVGDGPEKENLMKIAQQMISKDKIIFVGAQSNPYPYLKKARLLALPSLSEAFPCVLIESMAFGVTPVVTPTSGAIECTKNGKYGYISKSFDSIDEFSQIILKGLNAPLDRTNLINYSKRFDKCIVSKQYLELFTK